VAPGARRHRPASGADERHRALSAHQGRFERANHHHFGENGGRSKVEALDSGADDYLVRPFETDELLARVRAVLRRGTSTASEPVGSFEAGDFRIDLDARRVHSRTYEVRLTPKEFELFLYLARRPNRVIPYPRLLSAVWESGGLSIAITCTSSCASSVGSSKRIHRGRDIS
jgi:hypothetical protein